MRELTDIFEMVLRLSYSASWLIVAVLAARLLLKKAPKNVYCVLWLLVGVRLAVPFFVETAFGLLPSQNSANKMTGVYESSDAMQGISNISNVDIASGDGYVVVGVQETPSSYDFAVIDTDIFIFAISWAVGVAVMLIYMLISWFRLSRRVRFAVPDEYDGIKFYRCGGIGSPFLFGLVRPRIYISENMGGEELGFVLTHELTLCNSRDYIAKPIAFILLSVHWFIPLVRAAYVMLCGDIELACDERVVRELGEERKKDYSQALLSCAAKRRTIAACPVAFGEIGVKKRIKNILSYKKPALWVSAAAALVCAVIALCFMTNRQESVSETAAYDDAADYAIQWADAFCARNGDAIAAMSDEKTIQGMMEAQLLGTAVTDGDEAHFTLGWSSPWPWSGDDYKIVSVTQSDIVILYYAWTSDPHVTVWKEELTYELSDGEFLVTSQQLQYLDAICTADEFYAAYPEGEISGTMMDYYAYNGSGEALNQNAKNQNMSASAYEGLDAPDTAAVKLLNILDNPNKVSIDVKYNDSMTEALVQFTFLEDNSTAQVMMIKPYGDDSIWLAQTY